MRTVLAFEPDPRQAAALKLVVKDRVGANFVLAESKDAALAAIRSAVPDLILLTALISPRDEKEIADLIRKLDGAEHTQRNDEQHGRRDRPALVQRREAQEYDRE